MVLNRQASELERLRLACKVDSEEVVPKAQEMLRLMDVKCRPGSLGKGELCRTVVAFDLACRAVACEVPQKTVVKLCGAAEADYASAVGTAQRLLGVQRRYTCKDVGTAVGNRVVGDMATTELKKYKERFMAAYPARQVACMDLNRTVYAVAVFYLCAKKHKYPADKRRLLELSLVGEAEFSSVCRSMLDLCYDTLGVSVTDKPTPARFQQFKNAAALNNAADRRTPPSGQNTVAATGTSAATVNRVGGASSPSSSLTAALGSRKGANRKFCGGGGRPSIPLTRPKEGGASKTHVAFLAKSIHGALGKRRNGGTTVDRVEPGGANDTNDTLHDTVHRSKKRPRPAVVPAGNAGRGSGGGGANRSSAAATASARAPPPPYSPPAVCNPYAALRPQSRGGGVTGARIIQAHHSPPRSAGATDRGTEDGRGRVPSSNDGVGDAAAGGIAVGREPGGGGYAEWKDRVLMNMENRMKGSGAASSSVPAVDGGCSSTISAGSGHTTTENSRAAAHAVSPAVTLAKQSSLTSFFAPSARE